MTNRRSFFKYLGVGVPALVSSRELLAATPAQRFAMLIDLRRCTGCLSCTVSCAVENGTSPGVYRTQVKQFTLAQESGHPLALSVPVQCNHCSDPACVKVCPVKAAQQRADGIVVTDKPACIGCGLCVSACPYGARQIDPLTKKAESCNFCLKRTSVGLLPACVESCAGGARVFGDLNDPKSRIHQLVKSNEVYALMTEAKTHPNVLYIGLAGRPSDKQILAAKTADWQR